MTEKAVLHHQRHGKRVQVVSVLRDILSAGLSPVRALLPGLPRDHPESYHSFLWNNFFKHLDISAENVHILDGNAPDLQAECDAFEDKTKAAGGTELCWR